MKYCSNDNNSGKHPQLTSEVIEELGASSDPLERDLGQALLKWQNGKASQGLSRSLGYEPREIRQKGAVAVIEARVLKGSSGFENIDQDFSYEAIVDRYPDRFRDEVVATARHRLQSNEPASTGLTSEDIHLIASSRSKDRYADLSEKEHAAYVKISNTLDYLGNILKQKLKNSSKFEVRNTAGFNINSGVRSYIPKDLWFSVSPRENAEGLAGLPQLFMIISERGIEYGYGASVSPSDFSQPTVKEIVRKAAPIVFRQLPSPGSAEATELQNNLKASGNWFFRRKHRLAPNQPEFPSFKDWLRYLQSPDGTRNAAGTISRYLMPEEVDGAQLEHAMGEMARLFETLMIRDWHADGKEEELMPDEHAESLSREENTSEKPGEFSSLFSNFLSCFGARRSGAFTVDDELAMAMRRVQNWLEQVPAVADRPTIKVKIGVGQGGWTKTPWIALLDNRETTTTQRGTYVVFLIAEDLSITYLTLNQGMTVLRKRLGQRGAAEEMVRVAETTRPLIPELRDAGFQLDNDINLHSDTDAAKNYEIGTIAHVAWPSDALPDDAAVHRHILALLEAYDLVIKASRGTSDEQSDEPSSAGDGPQVEPFGIDDALRELFLERDDVERYLDTWRNKKNLILQGAPGVGKSFIARQLAYALIGFEDESKVQTVQFHQS